MFNHHHDIIILTTATLHNSTLNAVRRFIFGFKNNSPFLFSPFRPAHIGAAPTRHFVVRVVFFAIVSTLGRTIIFHHDVIVKMSKSPPNPKSFDFWREKRDEKKGNSFLR